MKEIGSQLQKARLKKNLSLSDVQEITKIRSVYLEAMENGNFEKIPGEVYRKGFLVNYANALEIDSNPLLERYNQIRGAELRRESTQEEYADVKVVAIKDEKEEKVAVTAVKEHNKRKFKLKNAGNLRAALVILIVIILFSVVIKSLSNLGSSKMIRANSRDAKQYTVTDKSTEAVSVESVASEEDVALDESGEAVETATGEPNSATAINDLRVTAEFTETVWMDITVDDQSIYPGSGATFYPTSPKQEWVGNKKVDLYVGNIGGVKLRLNGKLLENLGESGIVRKLTITASGVTIIE